MITKRDFINFCNLHWDCPDYEVARAMGNMNHLREPLEMANPRVADHIRDLAEEFTIDNNLDNDWFDKNFNSEEEVFWELDI